MYSADVAGLHNQLVSSDSSAYVFVHKSLKLLDTILDLKNIYDKAGKDYRLHGITCLLSNLTCLSELDRFFSPQINNRPLGEKKSSWVIKLIGLVGHQQNVSNESAFIQTEWSFSDMRDLDNQQIVREYSQLCKKIDYSIIRDPLIRPKNKYLECLDCVASYSFKALNTILSKSQISLEAALYAVSQELPSAVSHEQNR